MRRIRRIRRLPLLGVTLVAVLGLAGVGYAASNLTVPPGTTDALVESPANMNLSTTGKKSVVVDQMSLPAGSWVLSSEATVVNFGPSDYVRCEVYAGGHQIASGATMVGNGALTGGRGPGAYLAGRGLLGSVTSNGPFIAVLYCSHDNSTPSGQPAPYVDAGAVLWAHAAGTLDGVTH